MVESNFKDSQNYIYFDLNTNTLCLPISNKINDLRSNKIQEIGIYNDTKTHQLNYNEISNNFTNNILANIKGRGITLNDIITLKFTNNYISINNINFINKNLPINSMELSKLFNFTLYFNKCINLTEIKINSSYIEHIIYQLNLDLNNPLYSLIDYLFLTFPYLETIIIDEYTITRVLYNNQQINKQFTEYIKNKIHQGEWERLVNWALKNNNPSKIKISPTYNDLWIQNNYKKGRYGIFSGFLRGYGKIIKPKNKKKGLFGIFGKGENK